MSAMQETAEVTEARDIGSDIAQLLTTGFAGVNCHSNNVYTPDTEVYFVVIQFYHSISGSFHVKSTKPSHSTFFDFS